MLSNFQTGARIVKINLIDGDTDRQFEQCDQIAQSLAIYNNDSLLSNIKMPKLVQKLAKY